MQNHPQWQEELDHLASTRVTIARLLTEKISQGRILTEQQSDINRNMWDDTSGFSDMEGISEFMQHIDLLKQNMAWARFNREEIERLDRLFVSPYFARIDYAMTGETPVPCYIGITTLMDEDTARVRIFDWRAPISSLFYDSEPGPVQYMSPNGLIHGKMTMKRQFRLDGGELVLMFDAGLAIYDDILQEILAAATGGRMRQIVTSIQKEQNRAIRFDDTRVLAVQGAAGSGKTSIAMHRAAYLLYRHRATIKAENLVILSPNAILGEYIANVLPELGEEEITGTPFTTLAEEHLALKGLRLETHAEMMEETLTADDPIRRAGMNIKTSPSFLAALEQFAESLSATFPFHDIRLNGDTLVSAEDLLQLYSSDFKQMGIGRRLERIRIRVMEILHQVERARMKQKKEFMHAEDPSPDGKEASIRGRAALRHELHRLREDVEARLQLDALTLYQRFLGENAPSPSLLALCGEWLTGDGSVFRKEGFPGTEAGLAAAIRTRTQDSMAAGTLPYEDLAGVFHLALCTSLCNPDLKAKHVLVDEAQDYSAVQYGVFRRLYPHSGITLLGDSNQNIRTDFAIGHLDAAASLLAPEDNLVLSLKRSYRSTLQISRFADAFQLEPVHTEHFGRVGEKPELRFGNNWGDLPAILMPLLNKDHEGGKKTVALITRTMADAEFLHSLFASVTPEPVERTIPPVADAAMEALMLQAGVDDSVKLPHPGKSRVLRKTTGTARFAGYPVHLVDESFRPALDGVLIIPSYLAKGLEFDHAIVILARRSEYIAQEERGLFHTVCSRALHQLTLISLEGAPDILAGVAANLYEQHAGM